MQTQKGFTIIELIVVIAIIAVLASIVLINVTGYINKGKDAAIKGNMSAILVNGASYFDTCGQYTANAGSPITSCQTAFLSSSGYTGPEAAVNAASGGNATEVATATAFCSCTSLKNSTNTYCVDGAGYKKETATVCATRCPAAGACVD